MKMLFKEFGHVLLLLLTTVLIVGSFAANYEDFLMKHHDYLNSNTGFYYCNAMMQRRGMTAPRCKQVNSFIHDLKTEITAVCAGKGVPYGNKLRRSLKQFSVTICTLKGSRIRPPCHYRDTFSYRYIVIACVDGKPVHYEEGHTPFGQEYE